MAMHRALQNTCYPSLFVNGVNVTVLDSPQQIALYRFKTLIVGLRLEIAGMPRHGKSCYSILKQERGYKGNKVKVMELAKADYDKESISLFPLS